MMTIRVNEAHAAGIPTKDFLVYRGLLCFYSGFFDCALNGHFKETSSSGYEVNDCTIKIFTIFFYWLNTSRVAFDTLGDPPDERDIVDLYIFADFYAVLQLKNRALEILFSTYMAQGYIIFSVVSIYDWTSQADAMKNLRPMQ